MRLCAPNPLSFLDEKQISNLHHQFNAPFNNEKNNIKYNVPSVSHFFVGEKKKKIILNCDEVSLDLKITMIGQFRNVDGLSRTENHLYWRQTKEKQKEKLHKKEKELKQIILGTEYCVSLFSELLMMVAWAF